MKMDWKSTCRVCLESGDMVSLFDWDENKKQLCDKYAYCCGFEVTKNDPLPKSLCLDCVDRLTYAYEFKVQCVSSIKALRECLEEYVNISQPQVGPPAPPAAAESDPLTETLTVKQENGIILQYTVVKTPNYSVVTKAPAPNKRGRPRKYINGQEPPYYFENKTPDVQPNTKGGEVDSDNEVIQTMQLINSGSEQQLPTKNQKNEDGKDVLTNKKPLESVSHGYIKLKTKKINPMAKNDNVAKERRFKCETCDSAFFTNSSLQNHIRRHLGIKPFLCSICGFACTANLELRRHMMKHTGDRPYKCCMCDRSFSDYGSWQKHERVHTGKRPYQCKVCDKSFNYSYVLSNHMATHTGDKKYSCDQCNKKFIKAVEVQWHNKRYHKELYEQQILQAELKKSRQKIDRIQISSVVSHDVNEDERMLLVVEANEQKRKSAVKVEMN